MKKIREVSEVVEYVLRRYPYTRSSDNSLYKEVCTYMNPQITSMSFVDIFDHINDLGLPQYESVSRSRRKLQNEYEDLRAPKEVEDERYESFKVVMDYV